MQCVMGLALVQLRVTTVCFCLPQFFFFFNAAHAVPCLEKISILPTCQLLVSLRGTLLYFILATTVVSFFFLLQACLFAFRPDARQVLWHALHYLK